MSSTEQPTSQAKIPDLAESRAKLLESIRRAVVDRRQLVDLGEVQVRWQRGGETFEDGERVLLALATGLYLRLPAYRGGEKVDGHWLHHGPSDNIESILMPHIDKMSVMDLESLRVGISASAVLRDIAAERSSKRDAAANSAAGDTSSTPPARRMRMH